MVDEEGSKTDLFKFKYERKPAQTLKHQIMCRERKRAVKRKIINGCHGVTLPVLGIQSGPKIFNSFLVLVLYIAAVTFK